MNGVLYFGLLGKAAIACWNSEFLDYGTNSIEKIAVNSKTLQFPMAIKVTTENYPEVFSLGRGQNLAFFLRFLRSSGSRTAARCS